MMTRNPTKDSLETSFLKDFHRAGHLTVFVGSSSLSSHFSATSLRLKMCSARHAGARAWKGVIARYAKKLLTRIRFSSSPSAQTLTTDIVGDGWKS